MDKIWLRSHPPGVPAEINPDEYASLTAIIDRSLDRYRDRVAFSCMDRRLTYGELDVLEAGASPPGCSASRVCAGATGTRRACCLL